MSWIDKVVGEELTITTGDGITYGTVDGSGARILYKNPKTSIDYNTVALQFSGIDGAQVESGANSYGVYPLEIMFQGADHIQDANQFLESAKDRRIWTINHPYYDDIRCRPVSSDRDNSNQNVTVITCTVWESIILPEGSIDIDPRLDVLNSINNSNETLISEASKMAPTSKDIASINQTTNRVGLKNKRLAASDLDLGTINQAIARTNATLGTLGSAPSSYLRAAANIIRSPARFYATINKRIEVLQESLDDFYLSLGSIPSLAEKINYEINGGLVIVAMSEAALYTQADIAKEQQSEVLVSTSSTDNEEIEIITRRDIIELLNSIITAYNTYISRLGLLQSEKDNKLDSYYPSPYSIRAVRTVFNKLCGTLFSIAENAKQERTYTLQEDLPMIVVVSKLLGKRDSETIDLFIKSNNILMEEYPLLLKGRKIKYYI